MTEIKRSEAKAILRNYHALVERQYKGDVDAIVTLVDIGVAIRLANLTDRQVEAITLVYDYGLSQQETANVLGIEQTHVSRLIQRAVGSIDAIYDKWTEVDG